MGGKHFIALGAWALASVVLLGCGGSGSSSGSGGGTTGGTFASRTYPSLIDLNGTSQHFTLTTGKGTSLTGVFDATPALQNVVERAGPDFTGSYDAKTGMLNATGTYQGQPITASGTLPASPNGGLIQMVLKGTVYSTELGDDRPNVIYFSDLADVNGKSIDSDSVSPNSPMATGFVDSAGHLSSYTDTSGNPHPASMAADAYTFNGSDIGLTLFTEQTAIGSGSILLPTAVSGSVGPGQCLLSWSDGHVSFHAISGKVFLDKVDSSTHQIVYHLDNVTMEGYGSLYGGNFGFGQFKAHGIFIGSYNDIPN